MVEQESKGGLFLVGTPIGNLEDITYRAVKTLVEADLIACEDTRVALKLLNHLGLKKKLISYEKFSEEEKKNYLLELVATGKKIALISDAGMPGISDPGEILVKEAWRRGIVPVVIPGPSAFVSALVSSGLSAERFFFQGFLPKGKTKERLDILKELEEIRATLIFYISPHALVKDLEVIQEVLGNRNGVLARELTKYYEEIIRGSLKELLQVAEARNLKGEMVLLVEGFNIKKEELPIEDQYQLYLDLLENRGYKAKEAIKEAAVRSGGSRNKLYEYILRKKEEENGK